MAAAISAADRDVSLVIQFFHLDMKSKTAFGSSMEMVERLNRSREHFLTSLQLRARSAGLAITNVPSSHYCDILPQSTCGSHGPNYFVDKVGSRTSASRSFEGIYSSLSETGPTSGQEIPKIFPERPRRSLAPRSSRGHRYSICQLTVADRDQHRSTPVHQPHT
jgi:hypothetical protein